MQANRIFVAGALALAASFTFAGDLTRAQVRAELQQARAAGQGQLAGEAAYVGPQAPASAVSRDAVKQELAAARAGGQLLAAGEGGVRDGREFDTTSVYTRAEVKAELLAARRAGEVSQGEAYNLAESHPKADERPASIFAIFGRGKRSADATHE